MLRKATAAALSAFVAIPSPALAADVGRRVLATPQVVQAIGSGLTLPSFPKPALAPLAPQAPGLPEAAPAALPPSAAPAQPAAEPPARAGFARIESLADEALGSAGDVSRLDAEEAAGLGGSLGEILSGGDGATPPAAPLAAAGDQTPEQQRMLRELKVVANIFISHYGPVEFKQAERGVDFKREYQKARALVLAEPAMPQRKFQKLLSSFVASAQDYHAGISFYATEASKLPLTILGAEGRYFILSVDRDALPQAQFPYEAGTEVLEFAGKPVAEAVRALKSVPNTAETDERLAQLQLTARAARRAMDVPQGEVSLKLKTAAGEIKDVALTWTYRPEQIPTDIPARGEPIGLEDAAEDIAQALEAPAPANPLREKLSRLVEEFLRPMAHPDAPAMAEDAAADSGNGYAIGGRRSFVPRLGPVVWELPAEMAQKIPFDTYIYADEKGRKIGYIRIPDYMAGGNFEQAAIVFAHLIAKYQKDTDALVIDQVNNPGGSVPYVYALLSLLTDKPLQVPPHRMIIDESDAQMALEIKSSAERDDSAKILEKLFEQNLAAFSIAARRNPMVEFADFILSQFKAGKRLTDETPLLGIDSIEPNEAARYTKPLLVLINELDFSGGDFFPNILKNNGRATLFGVRTAGAGGAVKSVRWPNQFGIAQLAYTWTIAMRWIIENFGVTPHVPYSITAADLQDGFKGYAKAVNDAVGALIKDVPAPAPAPATPPAADAPAADPKPEA